MKKLITIITLGALLAACSSTPKNESKGMKITKVNVNQTLPDSTQWVSSDTVIYDAQGRLTKVDFTHFSYTDGKVIADYDSVRLNQPMMRRCEVTTQLGQPITMLINYYSSPQTAGMVSQGEVTVTDTLVTLDLKHSMPGYPEPFNEVLSWRMDADGRLISKRSDPVIEGVEAWSEATYQYAKDSKMENQDLQVLAFYLQPADLEDLVLMMAGYLPALKKDIVTKMHTSYKRGPEAMEEDGSNNFTFDADGRLVAAKAVYGEQQTQNLTVEY